jgi:hypothetical protein
MENMTKDDMISVVIPSKQHKEFVMKQVNEKLRRRGSALLRALWMLVPLFALNSCAKTQESAPDTQSGSFVPHSFIDINRYGLTESFLSAGEIKNLSTSYIPDSNGLDYSDRNNWFILPDRKTSNVDVFLIYPTLILDSGEPDFIRPFWFNTPPLAAAQEIHRFHKKLVVELPCTACSVCRRHTEQRQAATRLVYTNEPPLK